MVESSNLRIPSDLLEEIKPLAARMSRAGVEMPWSRVALAALRKGTAQLKQELSAPPEGGPIAA